LFVSEIEEGEMSVVVWEGNIEKAIKIFRKKIVKDGVFQDLKLRAIPPQ